MEHVTLLGAEDVKRAASTMREAAQEMSRAAAEITEAVATLRRVLEDDRAERVTRQHVFFGGERP